MAEVITTAPKSKEAEIKLLIMPLGELASRLGDDEASTAIKAIANFVNHRSPGDKQMLPVSYADIASKHTDIVALRLPETKDAIDANFITNNVVGYVGAMKPIKHGARLMSEVGSLKVDDSLRGHEIESADEVPPEALKLCQDCPLYGRTGGKKYRCCDTVVVWHTPTETN